MNESSKQMMTPILTLYPYWHRGMWVFDDPRTGLKEEAFVLGMSEMISRLVETKGILNADKRVAVYFSVKPFDGYDAELTWMRSDDSQVLPGQDGKLGKADWWQLVLREILPARK